MTVSIVGNINLSKLALYSVGFSPKVRSNGKEK
jgi:hypothetical protein